MSLRRVRAMFGKEFRHILRDTRSLIMALFLPMFQMLLFGYALNLDVDRIPTLIFDGENEVIDRRAMVFTGNDKKKNLQVRLSLSGVVPRKLVPVKKGPAAF